MNDETNSNIIFRMIAYIQHFGCFTARQSLINPLCYPIDTAEEKVAVLYLDLYLDLYLYLDAVFGYPPTEGATYL